jgi:hypothetical protein
MANGFVNPDGNNSNSGNANNSPFSNRFIEDKKWMNDQLSSGTSHSGPINPDLKNSSQLSESFEYDYGKPQIDWGDFLKKNPAALMMILFISGLLLTFLLLIVFIKM